MQNNNNDYRYPSSSINNTFIGLTVTGLILPTEMMEKLLILSEKKDVSINDLLIEIIESFIEGEKLLEIDHNYTIDEIS